MTARSIGNGKGVVLPKPLLTQAGLEGLSQAPQAVVALGDDALLRGGFGNTDTAELSGWRAEKRGEIRLVNLDPSIGSTGR